MARYPLRSVVDGVALVTITAEDFAILTAGVEFENERALIVARMHEDAAEVERVLVMRNRARRTFPLSPGERFRLEEPVRRLHREVERPLFPPALPAVELTPAAIEEAAALAEEGKKGDEALAKAAKGRPRTRERVAVAQAAVDEAATLPAPLETPSSEG